MRWICLLIICLGFTSTAFAASFTVTSTAAANKQKLPSIYTCDGKDISPEFAWKNTPAKTESFALTLTDPDAPSGLFYHWLISNINKDTHELVEGIAQLPAGAVQGTNTWGSALYKGPCPPHGSLHHYIVSLYALDNISNLSTGFNEKELQNAMQDHVLSKATYEFTYSRK